jgi:ADP-ribose pyrophosphatase YjhB (NUDIX family)
VQPVAAFKLGAFAVIVDDEGRVLLCHRRDVDLWNLPGGVVEASEAPWQAVLREVREETGLEAAIERLAIVDYRPGKGEVVFTFTCAVTGGALATSDEADASAWFAPAALPENTAARHVERIAPVLAGGPLPLLRTQHGPPSVAELPPRG